MADERDVDPQETREWLDALDSVLEKEGIGRAHHLIERLIDRARRSGAHLPYKATTAYLNTIRKSDEERLPGEPGLEHRILSINRWNALAMVMKANLVSKDLGGHIATYASSATLYKVAFSHFLHAPTEEHGGDLVYFQGHSAPGIYARAFLEGRLGEEQLRHFRREVGGGGLSSYPHPWLMPDFWQFPTVSMGLSPLMAIYQARFMKYLEQRGLLDSSRRKVWAFMGDGEMDEPEALGAISLAAREELDNLIFVINCNLQRLDGPVRGNSKIIQELEGGFRGSGWNVLKVIWGEGWDPLFAKDKKGLLLKRMEEALDGDYQNYKAKGGAYIREHFFGKYPELLQMVADMTDDDIWRLNRGGHDPQKVYAAYAAAMKHEGQPTVILAKTVKGFGLGKSGQSVNIAHQLKKPGKEALRTFRDSYRLPIPDDELEEAPFYKPPEKSAEMMYLRERREALGGFLPARRRAAAPLELPGFEVFESQTEGTGEREISTTMAFVRMLTALTRHESIGKHVVPIVPDEARTFGMEGLFRTLERGGRHLLVDRRRNLLQQPRHRDDSLLHLLLDVRLSTRGRPRVGRGRQPGARLPAGRHLRTHDAGGGGAAAPGRSQPRAGLHHPELPYLRPHLQLRAGRDSPRRPRAHVSRPGERLLLRDADERELRAPAHAGGREGGDRARDVPPARGAAAEAAYAAPG
jgi:pyruvate dehydrogenase E1 component